MGPPRTHPEASKSSLFSASLFTKPFLVMNQSPIGFPTGEEKMLVNASPLHKSRGCAAGPRGRGDHGQRAPVPISQVC